MFWVVVALASSALGQSAPPRQGLDALSDDALMNELASRGMETLLERAFDLNNVPQAERAARRTLVSLSKLSDPGAKLTAAQRQKIVDEVVQGAQLALPTINDPQLLMRQVSVMITAGLERDINTLEYWGENPRTQAQVRPVADLLIQMLERCATLARAQAEQLANRITSPSDPLIPRYEEMDRLAATAEYTQHMVYYYLALSLDKSSPRRRQLTQKAIDYLQQFDVEENPDRNLVRTRIAKLRMIRGDHEAARETFDLVTEGSTAETRNIAIQYEARYFAALNELLARNINTAKAHLQDLLRWQEQNLPRQDQAARAGAEAASTMLQYRIHSLEAELSRDPAVRRRANDAAVATLTELLARRPDLRGIIYEQLLPRMEETTDLAQMDPLLLRALVARGEEQLRGDPSRIDRAQIDKALAAARLIVQRRGQPGVDEQMVDSATLLVGFFLEKLDRKPEAAAAFLDYVQQNPTSRNAALALDQAQALIGELRRTQREDPQVVALYERFLPLAIDPPFSRVQFAFEYARRLQLNGDYRQAVRFFRLVPMDDPRALEARYFELVALSQRLDEEDDLAAERGVILADVQRLADDVTRRATDAANRAPSDSQRQGYRGMLARTRLLAADLARREQNNPPRALELLNDFETSVRDLPAAEPLLADAMFIRVQAMMEQERYTDATQELVRLLQRTDGGHGAQIVYNLLQRLNDDFDRSQHAGDVPQMRVLARNRAQLSGFLVDWAANNPDENIRRFTYRYKVYDADTHRRAADLEPDPDARRAGLQQALKKFEALESHENVQLYRQSIDPSLVDPDAPDPQVEFGRALIEYDLGNWQAAAERFSRLLTSRRIGSPISPIEEGGEVRYTDNDAYWEVVLKLIRCNQKLGTGIEQSRSFLKQHYITWGDRVGGRKWRDEFDALRHELIPDFDLPAGTQPAE